MYGRRSVVDLGWRSCSCRMGFDRYSLLTCRCSSNYRPKKKKKDVVVTVGNLSGINGKQKIEAGFEHESTISL